MRRDRNMILTVNELTVLSKALDCYKKEVMNTHNKCAKILPNPNWFNREGDFRIVENLQDRIDSKLHLYNQILENYEEKYETGEEK